MQLNPGRPQSSPLVDLKDSIQVHLLTETALTDSKRFEILSQEEVDNLKKQIQSLTVRIEQAQANLAIQSKFRDAAVSMAKLYSPESKRRSLLGNRTSTADSAKEAELERQASERRCEELATELYTLEKRIMEPEKRLLQHTAAILQLTHRASKKAPAGQLPNGIPGSPESLYTYSNGRNSLDPPNDEGYPDDWNLGGLGGSKSGFDIPMKSPIREQNTQLRDEADRLKEQLSRLQVESDATGTETKAQVKLVADAQARLETLNKQVREMIVALNPDENARLNTPPAASGTGLPDQFAYLESSLGTIETELSKALNLSSTASASKQNADQIEAMLMGLWEIIQTGLAEIRQQNTERRKLRAEKGLEDDEDDLSGDESSPTDESYSLQAFSTKVQWLYAQATGLKEEKGILKRQIKQQRELSNKSGSEKDTELKQRIDELEQARGELRGAEKEVADVMMQLEERNDKIAALEAGQKDTETELTEIEKSFNGIKTQLAQANETRANAEAAAAKLEEYAKEKDGELEQLNVMVIELKTEVAFAKAELDGAYGSRRERAAEAAALSNRSETTELSTQVSKLKEELGTTLKELEDMTKETLTAEREKLEIENRLDDALAAKVSLDSEVKVLRGKLDSEVLGLKEKLDAERLRVPPSPGPMGGPRAGASMLSEQFRATMKEERKKFQEELRVSFPSVFPPCQAFPARLC